MATKNTILVDIDPTANSHPAFDKAIWLAKHYDTTLELFICDYAPYLESEDGRESLLKAHRDRLLAMAAKAEAAGVNATIDAVWDHPIDAALVRKTEAIKPLMVVKDTHYHDVLKRSLFSNTDWNLIRHCPADLLLVKPAPLSEAVNILASVDPLNDHDKPANLDQRILSVSKELADRTHGTLSVFHSYDPTAAIAGASSTMATPIALPVGEITAALQERHQEALDQLTERFGVVADNVHMYQGTPADLLPAITEQQHTDIVVMGAISRRGLKRIFIGHTAERVLDRLPCDLLIIKPTDFASRDSSNTVEAA